MSNVEYLKTSRVIDYSELEKLKVIMDDEFYDVLQRYLDESIAVISELYSSFSEETENLPQAIDRLKHNSQGVGAVKLMQLADQIEQSFFSNGIEIAREFLPELQEVFAETHSQIKHYICENNKVAMN